MWLADGDAVSHARSIDARVMQQERKNPQIHTNLTTPL